MKAPCLNCPDHAVGCHSTCQKYASYKSYLEEMRNARKREQVTSDFFIIGCKKKKQARWKKNKR